MVSCSGTITQAAQVTQKDNAHFWATLSAQPSHTETLTFLLTSCDKTPIWSDPWSGSIHNFSLKWECQNPLTSFQLLKLCLLQHKEQGNWKQREVRFAGWNIKTSDRKKIYSPTPTFCTLLRWDHSSPGLNPAISCELLCFLFLCNAVGYVFHPIVLGRLYTFVCQ